MSIDDLAWHKSSYSNGDGGECVEVACLPGDRTALRDTKDHGTGPILRFTATEWTAFLRGVRAGHSG